MISGSLIELFYEAANIPRWNDHIRPAQGFSELDKQAQKLVIAFFLGKLHEDSGDKVDWTAVIEGALFEFLHRVRLTDIKPPVFYRLMAAKGAEINDWVLRSYADERSFDTAFLCRFEAHLKSEHTTTESQILRASHYMATKWEFDIVKELNSGFYGIEREAAEIDAELKNHSGLRGLKRLESEPTIKDLMELVSQLRFQQRWGQSPRVPQTSVLGHALIVALVVYFCCADLNAGAKRTYNNVFAGLFHDLPEVLTRDIVSPVKRAVSGLEDVIKGIEITEMNSRLYPLMPKSWVSEFRYFVENEHLPRMMVEDQVLIVEKRGADFNDDKFSALDGDVIKACDHLAAYTEAFLSIQHGIRSRHLNTAVNTLYYEYRDKTVAGLNFGKVYRQFDPLNL